MNVKRLGGLLALGAAALALLALPRSARGGAPASVGYVGSAACLACHTGELGTSWKSSPHSKAMWKLGAPNAGPVLGDFSGQPPFPKEQIAYVLGLGGHAQAYLDKDYRVLPGMWEAKGRQWAKMDPADAKTQCLGCHTTGFNGATNTWKDLAVGCEDCHGPGSAHITAAKKAGTMLNPTRLSPKLRTMVCAQCHAQGKSKDGVHAFPVGFQPGDDLDRFVTYAEQPAPGSMNRQYNDMRSSEARHLTHDVGCLTCHSGHGGTGPALRKGQPDLCADCHKNLTGDQHKPETANRVGCIACHRHMHVHAQ